MNKKLVLIIIIVVLFAVGFIMYSSESNSGDYVKIGKSNFIMPEGFYQGQLNNLGSINLTNGSNSIFISYNNNTNMEKEVNNLKDYFEGVNSSSNIIQYNIGDVPVYKLEVVDNSKSSFYWFEHNGEVYNIYNWDGIPNMDLMFEELVRSVN